MVQGAPLHKIISSISLTCFVMFWTWWIQKVTKGIVTHISHRNPSHSRPSHSAAVCPRASSRYFSTCPYQSRLFWRSQARCTPPWSRMAPCLYWNPKETQRGNAASQDDTQENNNKNNNNNACTALKRWRLISPQTVVEGLHSILGDAVRSPERADSPEHTGDVHHSASGHFYQREDAQCYVNYTAQVDGQHGLVVLYSEPVIGARRQGDAGVVHNTPQAWRNTTQGEGKHKYSRVLCITEK